MADIFIVDDDLMLQEMLSSHLQREGHSASCSSTLHDGIEQVMTGEYDIVFLDVQLPDGNGLEFIPQFKAAASSPEVVIITGKGDENGAEKAIVSGAWNYIEKPDVIKEVLLNLTRIMQYREERSKAQKIPLVLKRNAIIGDSPPLNRCLHHIAHAAVTDVSVLITGETGTGKEVTAKTIHENSLRTDSNFIVVDCAALSEDLIESILFGYVKGAFTGAERDREGLISQADGGTLFLDEIGELPIHLQKTFLRVLQEHRYRPVGSTHEIQSDFRVIAATNIDIEEAVQQGKFRNDLYYRLRGISFVLPPLRKRKEDIALLTRHFLAQICEKSHIQHKGIAVDLMEHLMAYEWPGNIRELQQTLEEVIAFAKEAPTLWAKHLPEFFRIRYARAAVVSPIPCNSVSLYAIPPPGQMTWQEYKNSYEKQFITELMAHCDENVTLACKLSQLSRTRLYQLRDKYGLTSSHIR